MNLFTYLYYQIYLIFKNVLKTDKPKFHALILLTGLEYLNIFSLFPDLRKLFEPELYGLDIVGVTTAVIVGLVIPLCTYLLINFNQIEGGKNEGSNGFIILSVYVLISLILFISTNYWF